MKAFVEYLRGAVHEIKNVTWPTEAETIRLTKITLSFVAFFTIIFFISDSVLSGIFTYLYSLK